MKKASILESFLGIALLELRESDYLSPEEPLGEGETVVDDMSDFEKGLYTLSQFSKSAIEKILNGTSPGKISRDETMQISKHASVGRLCVDLLRTSMEMRLPYSHKKTMFEIRSGFKIVEKKVTRQKKQASDIPKTFALCAGGQPAHAHFYGDNGKILSDSIYSKAEARAWLTLMIAGNAVPDEDHQGKLFEEIERVQLPSGNGSTAQA